MILNKILRIRSLFNVKNIRPNVVINKSFEEDWNKCFRLWIYLHCLRPDEIQEIIEITSSRNEQEDTRKTSKEIGNSYFQTSDFLSSIRKYLTEKKELDIQIELVTVETWLKKFFEYRETDIETFKTNLKQTLMLNDQQVAILVNELKPFGLKKIERTINNDLSDLSSVIVSNDKCILNIAERKYEPKVIGKDQSRGKNKTNDNVLVFGTKANNRLKFSIEYENEPHYKLPTLSNWLSYIIKGLIETKFKTNKLDELNPQEIQDLASQSLRLYLETLFIYYVISGYDRDEKRDIFKSDRTLIYLMQNELIKLKNPNKDHFFNLIEKLGMKEEFRNIEGVIGNSTEQDLRTYLDNKNIKDSLLNSNIFDNFTVDIEKSSYLNPDSVYQDFQLLDTIGIIQGESFYGINEDCPSISEILTTGENVEEIIDFNEFYFDELLSKTSESLKNKQRFFIKFQHINKGVETIEHIIDQLKLFWEENESKYNDNSEKSELTEIRYKSSSKKEKQAKNYVIYPISLFYNQRGIYLAAYGETPKTQEGNLDFYNYRLDHLESHPNKYKTQSQGEEYIKTVQWDENNKKIKLFSKLLSELSEDDSTETENQTINPFSMNSNHIYNQLTNALGVDLHREIKLTLLRFPRQFHYLYIKDSKRHDTFQLLSIKNGNDMVKYLERKFNELYKKEIISNVIKITDNEKQQIKNTLKAYPNDAYYIMNYRHGEEGGYDVEADVIMRLRAWGHNVEVLYPTDLRQRMREDMQKTWDLYQDDE